MVSVLRNLRKTALILALVMLLNIVFSPFSVSALPAQENEQSTDYFTSLTLEEKNQLLEFIEQNKSSVESAINGDVELNEKYIRYSAEYEPLEAIALVFIDEVSQNAVTDLSHSRMQSFSVESQDNYTIQALPVIPVIWAIVAAIIKAAVKKKMGPKIEKQIGDRFDKEVWPQLEPGIKKQFEKYKYGSHKGPEGTGSPNGILQGEHIISLKAPNGGEFLRLHVFKNQSGNETVWHWHQLDGGWSTHHKQTKMKHNTLPKWGSPDNE